MARMPSLGGKIARLQLHHPTWEVRSSQLAKSAKQGLNLAF